ncbi:MAG: ZIP family metal transporter, partial [Eudoraea sp.]
GTYMAAHMTFFEKYSGELTALVIGVFFHISTVILFETSEGHHFNLRKIIVILLGILIAFFV